MVDSASLKLANLGSSHCSVVVLALEESRWRPSFLRSLGPGEIRHAPDDSAVPGYTTVVLPRSRAVVSVGLVDKIAEVDKGCG